jgi:serralysin
MDKPIWTVDQIAAHLTRWQAAWDASAPIEYSFYETVPAHLVQQPSFTAFTLAQRQALADIFTLISDVVPLTFVNVTDNGLKPEAGNERISFYNLNGSTIPFWGAASIFWTEPNGDQLGVIQGSEIVVNRYRADAQGDWGPGDSNPRKLMHEALHALGLAHPGDYNGDSALNYENEAEYQQDSHQYTAMSYWTANNTGADHTIGSVTYYTATPMLHDVAALQLLYGANMSTRTGDTVYGFNSNAGRAAFDINANPFPIFTIWDAAGIDTLDLSGFATASAIDLREGGFTDAGGLTDNIAIAYGAIIENAVGGGGGDAITGNAASNRLDGGAGADLLQGLAGNDTYVVDAVGDSVVEAPDEGSDTVLSAVGYALGANLENLVLTGGAANSTAMSAILSAR